MTIDAVSEMTNNALYVIIKVSLPVLLVSLVVGLVISIFQTVTSIQEQTLTFVPKIVAIFLCLVVIGHWMSMGMMMLPPTTISMPFKILLFVLADGWALIIGQLVQTFY